MTTNPHCIDAELPLSDARERMARSRIRHLPVVDAGRVVGILTARDLLLTESLTGVDMESTPVGTMMSGELVTVGLDASIASVVRLMVDHHVGAIMVVDEAQLLGIFTDVDAVRLLQRAFIGA